MADVKYHEQINIQNEKKLKEILNTIPHFCREFFRGIEPTTSSRTRIAYAYDLRIFFEFLMENNPEFKKYDMKDVPLSLMDEIKAVDIEEYLDYLKYYNKDGVDVTNDENGRMRKLSSLRSFYKYFFRQERLKNNPAILVMMPKVHEHTITRLDIDEVARFLDAVESGEDLNSRQKAFHKKTAIRDLAMMTLLLGTGIRVSECVGLDLDDVDFRNGGLKIHRKGGNEVIVYFGEEVETALYDYLEQRNQIITKPGHEKALFLSLQNRRISVRAVEKMVKKYAALVTSLKHITPHKLRSTYGTNLYRETGDIYLVADVLGHSDVNTTRRHYAAIGEDRRRSAANKVTLREKGLDKN
ncbi:Site-specific recombinase XerD [Acetitomaculum ruminis DSM 5522]|uniref:Site-specific recombinase XerD n=1 Tax=Acetitomaculum ruminis DSM 5522 TaxID=1120918 RepID=A0A1I0VI40_9FIRM|nr:tyrosine-type recombinase/integrase [Acetitomaculum ruminis]SFA75703.1 Site-specific recombinase XerD [Acetitomaculum ruminis DSM 5522]